MFLADVAPELRDEQRVLFQNLRAVGMVVTYRRAEPWTDRPALRKFGLATGTFRVSMRYQITDARLAQTATDVGYTYTVRENRLWLVADDHLDRAIGSGRQPWDYGKIAVVKRKNILVIVNQGGELLAQNLADQTVRTAKAVRKLWKGHLQVVPVVVAMREPDVLTELPQMIPDDEPARIQAMPNPAANSQPVGGYLVIRPAALRTFDSAKETHALVHLLAVRLGDSAPRWLAEGMARYAENQQLVAAGRGPEIAEARTEINKRVLGDLTRLPADDEFSATDSYDISWVAVEHLIKQIGFKPVTEYYVQVARRGYNQFAQERLMKEYTGFTEATLVESLRSLAG
ncbi:hypothetical protein F1D05_12800 [Kribbella qitaiheensis]|uniref:Peptidase MA-like domain-containing protein n=2 Tax=Kribbella qitaiheensis TaxID=1544730 RepID=A0A7G6X9J3_9ACTN|nr:hypothetical protein F1D05_12800 [Kribbella qitaiheensis]